MVAAGTTRPPAWVVAQPRAGISRPTAPAPSPPRKARRDSAGGPPRSSVVVDVVGMRRHGPPPPVCRESADGLARIRRSTVPTGPPRDQGRRSGPAPAAGGRLRGRAGTPGFRSPLGSTAALAARSASANRSGRWRSYWGRCMRPTAWWWVMVPPASSTASEAASFTSVHIAISEPCAAEPRPRVVRRRSVRVHVGEPARQQRLVPEHLAQRGGDPLAHEGVELRPAVPGDRRLERVGDEPEARLDARARRR